MGLGCRERRDQHLMLGENVRAWALRAPSPWSLRTRRSCGTPSLQLPADHVLGPRQIQAVHLADNGIAGDSDLAGDLAARNPSMKATLQQLDALRTPGRTILGRVDGLAVLLWRAEVLGRDCRRRDVTKLWLIQPRHRR
jgi:hypothetical protein